MQELAAPAAGYDDEAGGVDVVAAAVVVGMLRPSLARQHHRAPCHLRLRLLRAARQLFDRMPVAIARRKVHAPVRLGWILLENPLDNADPLRSEWVTVVIDPHRAVLLAARGDDEDGSLAYRLTFDRAVVVRAARILMRRITM